MLQEVTMTDAEYEAMRAERLAEHDRLIGEGIIPGRNYKVRPLTSEDLDRAAREMLAIVAFPGMREGWIAFSDGLVEGRYTENRSAANAAWWSVMVEIPPAPDFDDCQRAILNEAAAQRADWRVQAEKERQAGGDPIGVFDLEADALEVA